MLMYGFTMKNLLHTEYKRGTNRYSFKRKHFLDIKPKVWISIVIILLVTGIIGTPAYLLGENQREQEMFSFSMKSYARTVNPEPTPPPLAPQPELESNTMLIKKIWGKDAKIGIAIARCESGLRSDAKHFNTNKTWDEGVFQVNTVHGMPDMFNPTANILYAYSLYRNQGNSPWLSSKKCWSSI